jgi:hypothetical protein
MKSEIPRPRKPVAGRRNSGTGIPHLPMEWMDPLSWRLPSGQALAEFALQTGFLAPLMMRAPKLTKKPKPADGGRGMGIDALAIKSAAAQERLEEAPGRMAAFRHSR